MAATGQRHSEGLSGPDSEGAWVSSDEGAGDNVPARKGWRRVVAAVVLFSFALSVISLGFFRSAYHRHPFERFLSAPLGTR